MVLQGLVLFFQKMQKLQYCNIARTVEECYKLDMNNIQDELSLTTPIKVEDLYKLSMRVEENF